MNIDRLVSRSSVQASVTISRVDHLDGWRGLAITIVLLAHFCIVPGFNNLGRLGVDIFFVLSGLLMGNILFIKKTPLIVFYKRRISRIIPAFLVFVISIYYFGYIQHFDFQITEVLATVTFLSAYLPAGHDIWNSSLPIGHLWSLNIEEHGYMLMSILTLPAIFQSRGWLPLLVIAFITIVIQLMYIYKIIPASTNFELRTECALAPLLLSAAYCQVAEKFRKFVEPWMTCFAFFSACLCYTKLFPWWANFLVAPFLLAFVVNHLSETWEVVRIALSQPVLRFLGIWSFSLYLWQQPFYVYKDSFFPGIALVLAILFGLFSYYCIENPIRIYLNSKW